MNRIIFAAYFVAFSAGTLRAQELTASVPFEFHVCNRVMPAGRYVIGVGGFRNDGRVLRLRGQSSENSCFLLASPTTDGAPTHEAALTFARYGNEYFLRGIWDGSSTSGRELPLSRPEKELRARNSGIEGMKQTVVALK